MLRGPDHTVRFWDGPRDLPVPETAATEEIATRAFGSRYSYLGETIGSSDTARRAGQTPNATPASQTMARRRIPARHVTKQYRTACSQAETDESTRGSSIP